MNDRARELADKYGISEADLHVLTSLPADPNTDSVPKATANAHAPGTLAVSVRDAGQRYEDLGLLGTGAMGEVRRVRDRELNRLMAMKVIRSRMMARPKVVARFIEEAQATAQLTHPGIVPVHELGRLLDGRLYFTMQLITGRTLRSILKEVHQASTHGNWGTTDDGVSLRQLVAFFKQACDAIAYAHARGVCHRDLKSENIMVGAYGEVQVVDWGLAKIWGEALAESLEDEPPEVVATHRSGQSALATQFGIVAGTPAYMPPEQAVGDVAAAVSRGIPLTRPEGPRE